MSGTRRDTPNSCCVSLRFFHGKCRFQQTMSFRTALAVRNLLFSGNSAPSLRTLRLKSLTYRRVPHVAFANANPVSFDPFSSSPLELKFFSRHVTSPVQYTFRQDRAIPAASGQSGPHVCVRADGL